MTIATRDNRLVSFLSLFTSLGTLFCCALPSLLVLLGLGATVASFLSSAPWLVSLSRHKLWVFALSGLMIAGNFYYVYHLAPRLQARALACPIDDPRCRTASRFSRVVLAMSAGIWLVGFFTAFVLGPVLTRLDS
jgi:hypothetical protein